VTRPVRWPVHPAPIDGEALSSWLHRDGAYYQMSVAELVEHGLGHDPDAVNDLDLYPPPALLDVLAERAGAERRRLRQMSLAGWVPAPADSREAQPSAFDAYVRRYSVLLKAGKRSKHPTGPWRAWIPRYRLQRAFPCCVEHPALQGLLLLWQLPLQLSCPRHGCILEACVGFPGEYLAWTGDETPPRAASETVMAMDQRSEQGLATGQVDLPGGTVDAAEWFALVRTLLDEVATPVTCWGSRAGDLRAIWAGCGSPVRAGQARWRPFEHYPWVVQSHMLEAVAEAIHLLENGTVHGGGADAGCFVIPAGDDVEPSEREGRTDWWVMAWAALEEVVATARAQPGEAQALYDFLSFGCREPGSIDQLLAAFAELGIPTAHLSHNKMASPFA